MSEEEKKAIDVFKSYINAIDVFGTIDYKCINNLYDPAQTILNLIKKHQAELENSISKDKIREIFNNKYKILKEMNNNFVAEVVFAHYESLEEELLLEKG